MDQTELDKWFVDELKDIWELLVKPLFTYRQVKVSPLNLLLSIFIVVISFRLAKLIGTAVNKVLASRQVDPGIRDSLERFTRYSIIILGFLFALDNLGISLTSLAAVGAILMVGIGFGLQNITQNFISGIIVLIERPVKVGDIIEVGGTSGRVLDIRVRSPIIQTRDGVAVILPNSKLVSEDVVSDSYTGEEIRQHIKVGVAYGSDIKKVKRLLLQVANSHEKVLKSPEPIVVFDNFGDSSLDFDLRVWCSDIWRMDIICSDLRFEIDQIFRENDVTIPFPQRDLHIVSDHTKRT